MTLILTEEVKEFLVVLRRHVEVGNQHLVIAARVLQSKPYQFAYVVPSLDLVIYKRGGNNGQYEPTLTRIPQPKPDMSRDDWKPIPRTPFHEGSLGGDDGLRRVLEMVSAAVRD